MAGASRLTAAQLAAAVVRDREGRPDKAAMSNEERLAAGLMDVQQAAEHEHLTVIPHPRLADRVRGPDPDDPWAAAADPAAAWQRAVWDAWEAAGHYERACDGWADDPRGNVICTTCDEAIPVPGQVAT